MTDSGPPLNASNVTNLVYDQLIIKYDLKLYV